MGDPTGIGAEIAAKALAKKGIYQICKPLVLGDAKVMQVACKVARANLKVNPIREITQVKYSYRTIDVYDLKNVDIRRLIYKKASKMGGKVSLDYIYKAIDLAMAKK